MGLFSRRENVLDKIKNNFIDQFPTWAFKNAQVLTDSVHELDLNKEMKSVLVDCFAGAHFVFLVATWPDDLKELLGGDKQLSKAVSLWPKRAKDFSILTLELYRKRSIESFYDSLNAEYSKGSAKRLEPISVYLSVCAVNFLKDEANYYDPNPPHHSIPQLYPKFFEISQEALDWVQSEVLEKAKR